MTIEKFNSLLEQAKVLVRKLHALGFSEELAIESGKDFLTVNNIKVQLFTNALVLHNELNSLLRP